MNAEKISRAMQYVNDALLMEYLQMDDKLTAEKIAARLRSLKRFATVACIVLFIFVTGVISHTLSNKPSISNTGLETEAVPVLLNDEKYQMFGDSQTVRKLLAEHGFPADYGADTIGEKLGYLEMAANTIDGRLCFAFTEEKTQYVLYAYVNTDGDDYYILQSEDNYLLLIKDNLVQ